MGYEHFSTTLVTELDKVSKSSIKNLIPILCECEVTSDNESESNEAVKDDSSVFTTFTNPLFSDSDDVTSNDNESIHDVLIEESKVHSNPLFDNDEINYDELESHVESNFVESLSNHDALIDSRMEMLFTMNLRPRPIVNANTIVESIPLPLIPIQDNDSQQEEIDIVTNTDDVLPLGFENDDDSEGEINAVEELQVDNSISNLQMNVMNVIDDLKCLNPKDEFDDDDYYSFMFVCSKMFLSFLSVESEDTIFDPGFTPHRLKFLVFNFIVPVRKNFTSFL
nr:hypothetical protein [Tanacetum cinerariifolium]